jgi:hypothetical protein
MVLTLTASLAARVVAVAAQLSQRQLLARPVAMAARLAAAVGAAASG